MPFLRLITAGAMGAALVAFASGGAFALESWNTVLAKAKKEGVVVVHGAPGKRYRAVFVKAFRKEHPDIKIKFSGASNRVDLPKLLRERNHTVIMLT